MKIFRTKFTKLMLVLAMVSVLLLPRDAFAHKSEYLFEIPEEVLQYIDKGVSAISIGSQALYVIQNMDTLGLAGILQLAGAIEELDVIFEGALSDIFESTGLSEMFSDISEGFMDITGELGEVFGDIFEDLDVMALADSLFSGDYFGAITSVLGEDLGLGNIIDSEIVSEFIGPIFSDVVQAAISGGDVGAVLQGAMMDIAYNALDFAIEQGTILAEEAFSALAEEFDLSELTDGLNEMFEGFGDIGIDLGSVLPSPSDLINAAINGGDFSGILSSMQSQMLSELQSAGMQIANEAIGQALEGFEAAINEAVADSELFKDLSDLWAEGSEIVGEINGVISEVNGVLGEVSGVYGELSGAFNGIAGGLGLDGIALATMPGYSADVAGILNSAFNFPTNTGALDVINGAIDGAYSSAAQQLALGSSGNAFGDVGISLSKSYGFSDINGKFSLASSPVVFASEASAIKSGNFNQINEVKLESINEVASQDAIKTAQLSVKNYQTMMGDLYGGVEASVASLEGRDFALDEKGLSQNDKVNVEIEKSETVSETEAKIIAMQNTKKLEMDEIRALISSYSANSEFITQYIALIRAQQSAANR